MKVIVQLDEDIKIFENVTDVKCLLAFDMFENKIEIYQSKNKTTFKQYEIIGFEIKEDTENANHAN